MAKGFNQPRARRYLSLLPNTALLGRLVRRQNSGQPGQPGRSGGSAPLRPGHDHIDLMAGAAGAYEPGAPIEHLRCRAVTLGHLAGVRLDLMLTSPCTKR
jgi:hypothetical protein